MELTLEEIENIVTNHLDIDLRKKLEPIHIQCLGLCILNYVKNMDQDAKIN